MFYIHLFALPGRQLTAKLSIDKPPSYQLDNCVSLNATVPSYSILFCLQMSRMHHYNYVLVRLSDCLLLTLLSVCPLIRIGVVEIHCAWEVMRIRLFQCIDKDRRMDQIRKNVQLISCNE